MNRWTEEEINILKEEYSKIDGKTTTGILKRVSKRINRNESAIRNKAYMLGITKRSKYYSEKEIDFLKENYDKLSMNDMAIILKRDESNIFRKMKELGLKKTKRTKNTINIRKKTKMAKETKEKLSNKMKLIIAEKGHPKGFKNHHHTIESKKKISKASKEKWQTMTNEEMEKRRIKQRITKINNGTLNPMKKQSNPYSRTKSGKREDLNNTYFRSSWEANIARLLNYKKIKWEFEPKTFIFHTIKKGCVSYLPDFYLPSEDKWIEVKGWMDAKSKTKLKRFEKYYPEEYKKLILIDQKKYNKIEKEFSKKIKNWE